jgi:hypothetical protein
MKNKYSEEWELLFLFIIMSIDLFIIIQNDSTFIKFDGPLRAIVVVLQTYIYFINTHKYMDGF